MKLWVIAKVCHQVNKALCEGFGDNSQKDWDDAEQWQRDSAIAGVEFLINNPTSTPEDQHESWVQTKLADGWKFGKTKDPSKKEHPCMVSYDSLPAEQQLKDSLFQAVVRSMIDLD